MVLYVTINPKVDKTILTGNVLNDYFHFHKKVAHKANIDSVALNMGDVCL